MTESASPMVHLAGLLLITVAYQQQAFACKCLGQPADQQADQTHHQTLRRGTRDAQPHKLHGVLRGNLSDQRYARLNQSPNLPAYAHPMSNQRELKWMDMCRDSVRQNETVINVLARAYSNFKIREPHAEEPPEPPIKRPKPTAPPNRRRPKRSIITLRGGAQSNYLARFEDYADHSERLRDPKPPQGITNNRWPELLVAKPRAAYTEAYHVQKTSFSAHKPRGSTSRLLHSTPLDGVQPHGEEVSTKQPPSTRLPGPVLAKLDTLVVEYFRGSVALSFVINRLMGLVSKMRPLISRVERALDERIGNQSLAIELAKRQDRSWLPNLDSLAPVEQPSSLNSITNGTIQSISEYLQLFGLAIEQMIYEESRQPAGKRVLGELHGLEDHATEMICAMESLANCSNIAISRKGEIFNMMDVYGLSGNDPPLNRLRSMDRMARNGQVRSLSFKSPMRREAASASTTLPKARDKLEELIIRSAAFRELMPREARDGASSELERLARDRSVIVDLGRFIRYFECSLCNIDI